MMFVPTYFALASAAAAVISGALALYAWPRRREPGGLYFSLFMAAAAWWAMAGALEYSAADESLQILFAKLAYPAVATIGPLWLLFALDYGRWTRPLRSRWLPLIWAVPAAVVALAFTNEWHHLTWPSIAPASDAAGANLVFALGPAVYVNAIYAYLLMLGGSLVLLEAAMRRPGRSNLPTMAVILGVLVSLVANVIYPTSLNPFPGLDITPLAFTISGLLVAWAVFGIRGQRLFDLRPAAREMLLRLMPDGAVVLDEDGHVVEINPAARRMLGLPAAAAGQEIGPVAGRWPGLVDCFRGEGDVEEEIAIDGPGGAAWLEIRAVALRDARGRRAGRLVLLRDVTNRRRAEEDLKRTNEALMGEVEEKDRAWRALDASLHEKDVLLKEIHHRVKNNLQIISSLLNLQTSSADRMATAELLRDSQNRIRSMALIHEKLYQARDISRVDFRDYAETLARNLFRSYTPGPRVALAVDVGQVSLDIDRAIPCGLIINELVSNSLKHAFPDGRAGEIRVALTKEGGTCTLVVADDGVGLPPGFDFRDTPSLGLQLVNMLAGQLEGTVELDTAGGTRFKITFAETG